MVHDHLDAVTRVARVFDYMIRNPSDVGVSELSRELGYSKSVVHRLLAALRNYDYVQTNEETRKYHLGFKAIQLGLAAQSRIDIRRLAMRRMEQIRSSTRETVNLSIRVGDHRVYIESLESPQELRQRVQIAREMPLYVGSSSKAILAFLESEEQDRIVQIAEGKITASGQAIHTEQLRQDLVKTRERGYAISIAERLDGTFSVAAPIFDHSGHVVASMSVAGPSVRWSDEAAAEYGSLLLAETQGLSRDLGYEQQVVLRAAD